MCGECHQKRVDKRIAEFDGDTDYMDDIVCPYCGYVHTDCFEWSDGENECSDCERKFEMYRDVTVTYSTSKIE